MSAAGKALWYIETHADQPLALADIAAAAGLSPFHLSRLFQARTGTSVVRYLRGRRLTAAAQRLANGAGDILQVALGAGYTCRVHPRLQRTVRADAGARTRTGRRWTGAGAGDPRG